jgi:hypothetical protein
MIFCHPCKIEEMIDDYYSDEWKCPKCNQPERSKREDSEKEHYDRGAFDLNIMVP